MNSNSDNTSKKGYAVGIRSEIEKLTTQFAKAVTNKDFAALGIFYGEKEFGKAWDIYARNTPVFLPRLQSKIVEANP